jgi:hypothetical protein
MGGDAVQGWPQYSLVYKGFPCQDSSADMELYRTAVTAVADVPKKGKLADATEQANTVL